MFLDDTACNLASLNLMRFVGKEDEAFQVDDFRFAVSLSILAQEILVDFASYPTRAIEKNSPSLQASWSWLRQSRGSADGRGQAI